jgi:NapC/NirT cytochrome c family, N-terminal region
VVSKERLASWSRPIVYLSRNWIMLTGTVLTTSAALTMIGFWMIEVLLQRAVHPYVGIILFLALPAVFVLGLLLIPIGAFVDYRRRRRAGAIDAPPTRLDLADPFARRAVALIALATGINVVLMSAAAYRGVEHMDSVQFCGLTCHKVMAPEYTAYLDSPHSRVACTECHIGPGAGWFVRSKLSGTRQLFAVAFGTYSRPIPSPVRHLRPSRETCEQCHWPQKFHGDKLIVRRKYDNDEASTPLTSVLVLKLGGRAWNGAVGIHGRHFDATNRIRYVSTDDKRQVIPRVTYRDDDGKDVEFVSTEVTPTAEQLARGETRAMDCIDCHNRPAHAFELPDRAVDNAIAGGRISRDLPFVKKKSVELLKVPYPDRDTAARQLAQGLADYYQATYPDVYRKRRSQISDAGEQLKAIYARNVFPEMKLTWGTHPNNVGHEDFAGCFRCHDDSHKSASGRVITQDCSACHTLLAQDEKDPKILAELEMAGAAAAAP